MADLCTCGLLKQKKAGTRLVDGVERCNNCGLPASLDPQRPVAVTVPRNMMSTLASIPGYRVTRFLGAVSVMATARTWGATTKSDNALADALDQISRAASALGGNAIIGLSANPFSVGRTGPATSDAVGMMMMGDAVAVEPDDGEGD